MVIRPMEFTVVSGGGGEGCTLHVVGGGWLILRGERYSVSTHVSCMILFTALFLSEGFVPKYFKALYDYNPVEQSLNDGVEEELAFAEGDIILVGDGN